MAWSRVLLTLAREYATSRVFGAARNRALVVYAGLVNGARRSLLIAFVVAGLLHLMTLSLVGAIVTGIFLWGGDDKLVILFALFTALFALPFVAVSVLMSERTWLKLAGAASPRE